MVLVARQVDIALHHLSRLEFSTDLGAEIGSGSWLRGFALMLSLSGSAIAFWPSLSFPPAPPAMRIDAAARDEFASHMIMPLGLGADTGTRMGPSADVAPYPVAPAVQPGERVTLVTTLAEGDTLGRMLQQVGVGEREAAQVAALLTAAMPAGEVPAGTSFDIALSPSGTNVLQRLDFHTRSDLAVAIERRGESLELSTLGNDFAEAPLPPSAFAQPPSALIPAPVARLAAPLPPMVDTTPLRIRGKVGASLYRSARAAGAPARAVQQYLQALGQHMNIDELHPDDTFDIILGYRRAAGEGAEAGDLLYAGLEHNGHPRARLLRWGHGGQFFDASGKPAEAASSHLVMPVAGPITSGFGMRFHPILGYTRMHEGIDLAAPWGAPIHAVASGVVSYAGLHGGHGEYVRLEHSGGLGSGYAHMSRIAVTPGTHVRAGQVIGYVGSSGLSTGAHLHYEVYRNGQTVNPMSVHFSARPGEKAPRDLAGFRARLGKLLLVTPGAALAPLVSATAKGLASR